MRRALSPFVPSECGSPQQAELLSLLDDCTTSRRVATACTECRSRKCKCDGNPEGCQACLDHDRECVFVAVTL
ncbi:hypothetical protein BCR35DRAFT_14666 [Leucosporidium creatinivorum]|uniref:Zn(2)-C6 fungal-type domain-containing protein n=1 Tax=Leucosporidium creatinivorum TaxID=106004 RepID=A0A1Y2FWV0_9BASI|nr:hypothetical protein BCR35DRAFT_14666 [Leucosporidium creatinivorum]